MQAKQPNQEMMKSLMEAISKKDLELFMQITDMWNKLNRPEVVEISDEEKRKADKIMAVFQDYIDGHRFFDIFYSKKFGYYRLDIEGGANQIDTADDLLECIVNEISSDVRELKIGGDHMTIYMRPEEEAELRKRVTPLIEKLDDSAHYLDILNAYIEEYRNDEYREKVENGC